ncbi:hypothetical protein [Bartonella sp. ML71XJBT]|nr:hypothetical protein [Bartonella sp. ML71XJBT]
MEQDLGFDQGAVLSFAGTLVLTGKEYKTRGSRAVIIGNISLMIMIASNA